MRAKKIGYLLSVLLLSSVFMYTVGALPDTSVTFRGVGITIDLAFPEEASPIDDSNIFHNLTITAYNYVTSLNTTLLIYAPIDSTWQIIDPPHSIFWSFPLGVNQSLPTVEINFTLPQNTNGALKCILYIQTNQTTDYSVCTFYTTRVSEPTFSEMQILYNEMLANYTTLQANYTTLLNDYYALIANYSDLYANYTELLSLYYETLANYTTLQANNTALLNDYDSLFTNYTSLFANYAALLSEHNQLIANYTKLQKDYAALSNSYTQRENEYTTDYNALNDKYTSQLSLSTTLQRNYDSLNSTYYGVQTDYGTLNQIYKTLNQTYLNLVDEFTNLQERSDISLNTDRIVMFMFVITLVALIAFIIYLKRGKEEPYVVIRKETVSVNPDEKSDAPS